MNFLKNKENHFGMGKDYESVISFFTVAAPTQADAEAKAAWLMARPRTRQGRCGYSGALDPRRGAAAAAAASCHVAAAACHAGDAACHAATAA